MAVAAAPAMLCYVTRPDAVLMEVEVEVKANGEDCLNQVRTRARRGARRPPEAEGPPGGARRRGLLVRGRAALRRRPGEPPPSRPRGAPGPVPAPAARGPGGRAPQACPLPPAPCPRPVLPRKRAAAHLPQVCAGCRLVGLPGPGGVLRGPQ